MQELLDDFTAEEKVVEESSNRLSIRVLYVQLGFALLAVVLAIYDIETIVGTGPIGSVIGLVVFGLAHKFDFPERKIIGLSAPILSVICFSLIYFGDWSPKDAHIPIAILIAIYTFLLYFVVVNEVRKSKRSSE